LVDYNYISNLNYILLVTSLPGKLLGRKNSDVRFKGSSLRIAKKETPRPLTDINQEEQQPYYLEPPAEGYTIASPKINHPPDNIHYL
jgi:hypothetical protein